MSNKKLAAQDARRPSTMHRANGSKSTVVGTMAFRNFIHLKTNEKSKVHIQKHNSKLIQFLKVVNNLLSMKVASHKFEVPGTSRGYISKYQIFLIIGK